MFTHDMSVQPEGGIQRVHLATLWNIYREFCKLAVTTNNYRGNSAADFLGWIEKRFDIMEEEYNKKQMEEQIDREIKESAGVANIDDRVTEAKLRRRKVKQ